MFVAVAVQIASPARADLSTTYTATSGTGSGSLSAEVDFTSSAGVLTVTLTNTSSIADFVSVGQAISALSFTLGNTLGTSTGTTAYSGQEGTIDSNGVVTYTTGGPDHFLGLNGGGSTPVIGGSSVALNAIGQGANDELITPLLANHGTYTGANNGITAHDPYTISPATFTFYYTGITANTTISSVRVGFGTMPDTYVDGTFISSVVVSPSVVTPEPSTVALAASSLPVGLVMWLRRRRKAQTP